MKPTYLFNRKRDELKMGNENEQALELMKEVAKEVAKDAYADAGRPVAKPTGDLLGLVPRAIKAALAPVEKWVLQQEYNVAETKKLLEEKLQNTPPELIQPPEPHIAVPALQYISYCMDNEELRNMYANLLANSMNSVVKNGVHPSFVEIIKQLCPDEAKILRYFYTHPFVPIVGLRVHKKNGKTVSAVPLFSNIADLCGCEDTAGCAKYLGNLSRLGLIITRDDESLVDKSLYEPLKNHPRMLSMKKHIDENPNVSQSTFEEGVQELSDFGNSFCSICIGKNKIIIGEILR